MLYYISVWFKFRKCRRILFRSILERHGKDRFYGIPTLKKPSATCESLRLNYSHRASTVCSHLRHKKVTVDYICFLYNHLSATHLVLFCGEKDYSK